MSKYKIADKIFDLNNVESPADLMDHTPEEKEFFQKAVLGQPSHAGFSSTGFDARGVKIPYSLGYHSIKSMRALLQGCEFKHKRMLEIGFNLGYSASIWLTMMPDIHLTSVDISDKAETLAAADACWKKFPSRFVFGRCDSKDIDKILAGPYDLAFVDGDHTEKGIVADIKACLNLGIRTMIFDDWLPQFGMTIPALAKFHVTSLEVHGNLAKAQF